MWIELALFGVFILVLVLIIATQRIQCAPRLSPLHARVNTGLLHIGPHRRLRHQYDCLGNYIGTPACILNNDSIPESDLDVAAYIVSGHQLV
jgi:hypothetical protein